MCGQNAVLANYNEQSQQKPTEIKPKIRVQAITRKMIKE